MKQKRQRMDKQRWYSYCPFIILNNKSNNGESSSSTIVGKPVFIENNTNNGSQQDIHFSSADICMKRTKLNSAKRSTGKIAKLSNTKTLVKNNSNSNYDVNLGRNCCSIHSPAGCYNTRVVPSPVNHQVTKNEFHFTMGAPRSHQFKQVVDIEAVENEQRKQKPIYSSIPDVRNDREHYHQHHYYCDNNEYRLSNKLTQFRNVTRYQYSYSQQELVPSTFNGTYPCSKHEEDLLRKKSNLKRISIANLLN